MKNLPKGFAVTGKTEEGLIVESSGCFWILGESVLEDFLSTEPSLSQFQEYVDRFRLNRAVDKYSGLSYLRWRGKCVESIAKQ